MDVPPKQMFVRRVEMTTMTKITSGQEKQYLRFVQDAAGRALKAASLDKDRLQQVLASGGKFQEVIQPHILAAVNQFSLSSQFANEEVSSNYGYSVGYKGLGTIPEQMKELRELIPDIGSANEELATRPLVTFAEGYAAIPRWEKVAKTYGEAVEKVFALIASKREFFNFCEGKLGAERLRQSARTVAMFQKLGDQQKGHDALIVPVQFGLRHRGKSVRHVREVWNENEFGLGAFATGILLLTHPKRLEKYEDLRIDCAGDESAGVDGDFRYVPYWRFGAALGFDTLLVSLREYSGSVSGFLWE